MTGEVNVPAPRVGTLGSVATFAGEATVRLHAASSPALGDVRYWPSVESLWAALLDGEVEYIVIGIERTGQPHEGVRIAQNPLYVVDQVHLPIACNLYVKPGTRPDEIRQIGGHGSIHQCRRYLDKHFPGVPRVVHALNSVDAAREMLEGDGSVAVVGSHSLPGLVSGLQVLARDIGDGAVSHWWLISRREQFAAEPNAVIVTGRFGFDGELGRLIAGLDGTGLSLRTAAAFPVDEGLSTYDYLLSFGGPPVALEAVRAALRRHPRARLAGAFRRTPLPAL